jgi:hypothetical protein
MIMNSLGDLHRRDGFFIKTFCLGLLLALAACSDDDSAIHHDGTVEMDKELAALVADNDVAYLAHLGLMRGHLHVGMALYDMGERTEAATHMKHPESELYLELVPGLQRRGAREFTNSLQALAIAVETGRPDTEVDSHYRALERDIALAETVLGELNPTQIAAVMRTMLEHVAEEYEMAVTSAGRMQNAHEYQDSLGFVHVINTYSAMLEEMSTDASRIQGLKTQLAFLDSIFKDLVPARNATLTPPSTTQQIISQLQVTLAGF